MRRKRSSSRKRPSPAQCQTACREFLSKVSKTRAFYCRRIVSPPIVSLYDICLCWSREGVSILIQQSLRRKRSAEHATLSTEAVNFLRSTYELLFFAACCLLLSFFYYCSYYFFLWVVVVWRSGFVGAAVGGRDCRVVCSV